MVIQILIDNIINKIIAWFKVSLDELIIPGKPCEVVVDVVVGHSRQPVLGSQDGLAQILFPMGSQVYTPPSEQKLEHCGP